MAKQKYLRELRRISENIPVELLSKLMKKELLAPTVKKVFEKALEDDTITQEQRDRFRTLLASGTLDREVEVVDMSVEKLIDAYYEAEIALAVKLGRLPKQAPKLMLKNNKGKQYARRQAARLKQLFNPEAGDDEGEEVDVREGDAADSAS